MCVDTEIAWQSIVNAIKFKFKLEIYDCLQYHASFCTHLLDRFLVGLNGFLKTFNCFIMNEFLFLFLFF